MNICGITLIRTIIESVTKLRFYKINRVIKEVKIKSFGKGQKYDNKYVK